MLLPERGTGHGGRLVLQCQHRVRLRENPYGLYLNIPASARRLPIAPEAPGGKGLMLTQAALRSDVMRRPLSAYSISTATTEGEADQQIALMGAVMSFAR